MISNTDPEKLFKRLDVDLLENIEDHYFQEPRDFRSLLQVLKVLNDGVEQIDRGNAIQGDLQSALKEQSPGQLRLQQQLDIVNKVIEEVVTFQHGGLNHSVDTMSDVVKEYTQGRNEIQGLRKALIETQSVLTAKKDKKTSMRELWLRKVELQESLRMVRDLEELKNTPLKVQRLMGQKKFYATVLCLTSAVNKMFGEDLVAVGALTSIREKIMDLKEVLLESCIAELKDAIIGATPDIFVKDPDELEQSDSEIGASESRSETMSVMHDDARSTVSFRKPSLPSNSIQNRDIQSGSVANPSQMFPFFSSNPLGRAVGSGLSAKDHTNSNLLTYWSLDLNAIDDAVEASLLDPSSTGPLYMRLLVKTIGVLHCEDDVERMLLDSLYQSFVERIVSRCKERAQLKMAQLVRDHGPFADEDEETLFYGKTFAQYSGALLDALLGLIQRLLFVFRLLAVSKNARGSEPNIEISMHRRKAVCELWSDMESVLLRELRVHLVEADVERISDRPVSFSFSYDGAGGSLPQQSGIGSVIGEDDDDRKVMENRLIFQPSARHAAVIYHLIVAYSIVALRVQKDSNLTAALNTEASLIPHQQQQQLALNDNKILQTLRMYVESDLIPVVQSSTNRILTDLQLQSNLFVPYQSPAPALDMWLPGNAACETTYALLQSLFRYWLQLFMHRDMVAVVIDRALRGFGMAVREARETLVYSFAGAERSVMKEMRRSMQSDPLYAFYKRRVFHGKHCLEEAITGSGDGGALGGASGQLPVDLLDDRSLFDFYLKEIFSIWPNTYWELSSASYPIGAQKALKSSGVLQQLGGLAYGADWMVRKAILLTNSSTRHGAGTLITSLGGGQGTEKSAPQLHAQQWRAMKSDLYDSKRNLASTSLECLRDLSQCSDESLSILRAELQILCFHFMARLATTPCLPTNEAASSSQTVRSSSSAPEEELMVMFVQQLTSFTQGVQSSMSPFALPILIGPLCALVPKLLSRAIIAQINNHNPSTIQAMVGVWRTKLLRLVVATQQQILTYVQSTLSIHKELAEGKRYICDVLALGFEGVRHMIAAIDLPAVELRAFVSKHFQDITRDELRFLWARASEKSAEVSMEELLRLHEQLLRSKSLLQPVSTVAHA